MILELHEGAKPAELAEVYADPYIARIRHDSSKPGPVLHPLATYYSATVNGAFAGVFLVIRYSLREIEIHALLLKKAVKWSRELGELVIDEAFSHPEVLRITAHILADLVSAKNYCLKLGFKMEGVRRAACVKNGKITDVHMLGLLRNEWRA